MCDSTEQVIKNINSFIPELGKVNTELEFSAHNFKTEGKMKIQNLNDEKIKKLSKKDIGIINTFFKKEEELLQFFGYSIIE